MLESLLIKLQASACNFIKNETMAQVFSCELCEISKNTFSYMTPLVAASGTKLIHQILDKLGADIININDKLKENVKDIKVSRFVKTVMVTN